MTDKRSNKRIKKMFAQAAALEAAHYLYKLGRKKPHFPVPAIVCRVIRFPEGNPHTEFPGVPYINWLAYNGVVGHYGPGYTTVRRTFYIDDVHYTINYGEE